MAFIDIKPLSYLGTGVRWEKPPVIKSFRSSYRITIAIAYRNYAEHFIQLLWRHYFDCLVMYVAVVVKVLCRIRTDF